MTLLHEKNKAIFEKVTQDYLAGKGTIEYCACKNGITKQTYYNIKDRLEKPKKSHRSSSTIPSSSRRSHRASDIEVEFIKTPKPIKQGKSGRSNLDIAEEIAIKAGRL